MKRKYLKAYLNKNLVEAGCDEAGRGCLAGPVVAAAVILPYSFSHPYLNDSKQMTVDQRNNLSIFIKQKALAYGIAFVDNQKIDEINILNASFLAMHLAVEQLLVKPQFLLIDGNRFNPYPEIPHSCQVKGDSRFKSIAAASVLAKTARDHYMEQLHQEHPHYNWLQNKGYPTKAHRLAIAENGISPYHRKTFRLS